MPERREWLPSRNQRDKDAFAVHAGRCGLEIVARRSVPDEDLWFYTVERNSTGATRRQTLGVFDTFDLAMDGVVYFEHYYADGQARQDAHEVLLPSFEELEKLRDEVIRDIGKNYGVMSEMGRRLGVPGQSVWSKMKRGRAQRKEREGS